MSEIKERDPLALLDYFEFAGTMYGARKESYPRYF
jgi:hypothetical protein